MAGYTILASNATYLYEEILSGSRPTRNVVGTGDSTMVRYRVERVDGGVIDPDQVQADVSSQLNFYAPHPVFSGLLMQGIFTREWDDSDRLAVVELEYKPYVPESGGSSGSDNNEEQWEFNFSAQPLNLKIVDATKQRTWERDSTNTVDAAGNTDVYSSIGHDIKGNSPEGVDVYRPAGSLVVRKAFDFASFTSVQRNIIYSLQGKLNNASFAGFEPSEVLFLGATMSYNYNSEVVTVSYSFLVGKKGSPIPVKVWNGSKTLGSNTTNVNVAKNTASDNFVYPFDYIWSQQQEIDVNLSNDPAEGTRKESAIASVNYVEVYDEDNFSGLGLGSGPA